MSVEEILATSADQLRGALTDKSANVQFSMTLPREIAAKFLALLDAERKGGAIVVPARSEFTTSEAAAILGVSRPFLIKLVDSGDIEHRMVGSHRRIPARAVVSYREHDLALRHAAMNELAALSNELGLVE